MCVTYKHRTLIRSGSLSRSYLHQLKGNNKQNHNKRDNILQFFILSWLLTVKLANTWATDLYEISLFHRTQKWTTTGWMFACKLLIKMIDTYIDKWYSMWRFSLCTPCKSCWPYSKKTEYLLSGCHYWNFQILRKRWMQAAHMRELCGFLINVCSARRELLSWEKTPPKFARDRAQCADRYQVLYENSSPYVDKAQVAPG